MKEEASFFESHGRRLFSVLHCPDDAQGPQADTGVIICDAFGEEKLWAHRVLVNFARFLTQRSFCVFRFDCMGHGDSEGISEEATVETQVDDILRATEVFRSRAGVRRIILHGVRFGATLAAIAASKSELASAVMLWSPIFDGEKYFHECLRSAVTTQMTIYGKVNYTRAEMVNDLLAGKSVAIDGYLFSSEMYKGIVKLQLVDILKSYQRPFAIIQVNRGQTETLSKDILNFCGVMKEAKWARRFSSVKGNWFWKELNIYPQYEGPLFEETLMALLNIVDELKAERLTMEHL